MQIRASTLAGATGAGLGTALADVTIWAIEAGFAIDIPDKPEIAFGVIFTALVALLSAALAPLTPAPVAAIPAPSPSGGLLAGLSSAPAAAIALLLVGSLALAGCSAIPGYESYKVAASGLVDQTIRDRMDWNDKKAEVVRAVTCDMSLGAFARMPAGDVKTGVGLICGIQVNALGSGGR